MALTPEEPLLLVFVEPHAFGGNESQPPADKAKRQKDQPEFQVHH